MKLTIKMAHQGFIAATERNFRCARTALKYLKAEGRNFGGGRHMPAVSIYKDGTVIGYNELARMTRGAA